LFREYFQAVLSKQLLRIQTSSRFFGSSVIAGTLLSVIGVGALHLLRRDYNPLRNFLSEYLVGPYGFLGTAAAFIMAATFLVLLAGLRRSVHPSGFLTASCILLGVMVIAVCVCAVFPIDLIPPDGSHPIFTRACIIHLASSVLGGAALIALVLTLPSAYKRDEKWRLFSQTTLFLGLLILLSLLGLILVPFYLRGLAQRVMGLVFLVWLLLTAQRLRQSIPSADC
jgi:hypothetical protein